jgi:BirA family transcriptional regulator, biotin operon repressor / biotin---[acetyl-CoA-carboxylase] ligase
MSAAPLDTPWPVSHFAEIDSTNEEARRRADRQDLGPAWIRADRQSAGRGRLGRPWDSPSGNLFATALMEVHVPLAEASRICFAAGLAVVDAAEACGAPQGRLRLKWPNDVLAGDAKVSGILIETGASGGRTYMAAGFGVNVRSAPEVPGRPTACLSQFAGCAQLRPDILLDALDEAFRMRLNMLFQQGFEPVRQDWMSRAAHLGKQIETGQDANRVAGVMRDVDPDGALVIELADGGLHRVRAGDVALLA